MKLAFVIQRYGREILGGGESLCRELAENLALNGEEVTVYTTTALDYLTWENYYKPGTTILRGVIIKRYKVKKKRELKSFNKFSDWLFFNPHNYEDEIRWLEEQGPVCPDLIKSLEKEQENYDLIVFFTYLYYPTYYGLKKIKKKKILVPFAHNEPPLYLEIMKEVFSLPDNFIFSSEPERDLVLKNFNITEKPSFVGGMGIKIPSIQKSVDFKKKWNLPFPYLLYAGRIDKGKGCDEMIDYFLKFKKNYPFLHLALIGKLNMELPKDYDIKYLGFLSENDKYELIANAELTIHPSRLESFSISLLESLTCRTPALVTQNSPVLMNHILKSNAGLYYSNQEEFAEVIFLILKNKKLRETLAENGFKYIKENYSWPKIIQNYMKAFKETIEI